jgi:hypothetical protein
MTSRGTIQCLPSKSSAFEIAYQRITESFTHRSHNSAIGVGVLAPFEALVIYGGEMIEASVQNQGDAALVARANEVHQLDV